MTDSGGQEMIEVPERNLFEVYSRLGDATTAAAMGNFNDCASLASDAKEKLSEIHKEATSR